jgi:hypothetical protein
VIVHAGWQERHKQNHCDPPSGSFDFH